MAKEALLEYQDVGCTNLLPSDGNEAKLGAKKPKRYLHSPEAEVSAPSTSLNIFDPRPCRLAQT